MDRVNRSLLVASAIFAIPVVLMMASLSNGTTPEVESAGVESPDVESSGVESADVALAVGQGDDSPDSDSIQQVVGKQPASRNTRPGLFQVISGAKEPGSRDHHHQNMSQEESKGLLDGFFEGSKRTNSRTSNRRTASSSSSSKSKTSSHTHQHKTHQQWSSKSDNKVNWDGIPYHTANSGKSKSTSAPIQDPGSQSVVASGPTRIIRGGSSRSVPAKPASVRRSSEPTLAKQPVKATPAPGPSKIAPMTSTAKSFSTSSSSRRSNRRTLEALDPSEIAAAAKSPAVSAAKTPSDALIPKVDRKTAKATMDAEHDELKPSEREKTEEKVAAKAAQPASDELVDNEEPARSSEATASPKTALATISAPKATPAEPTSAGSITEAEAKASPSVAPQPRYTTPVDPTTTPVPVAGIPAHPYAASTPQSANLAAQSGASPRASSTVAASPASHRAGPPNVAFAPGQIAGTQPYARPQYNAASAPVGSGVVPHSDVASYRRPSQPIYSTAQQLPSYPTADPYLRQGYQSAPRMTTNGQPLQDRTVSDRALPNVQPRMTRPSFETATIPMQPINSEFAPASNTTANPATDNFARSAYPNRNQMRDTSAGSSSGFQTAASSELPGIRVVTHGPSEIMIRQTNQYEIRVENRGAIDATGVMVRALVPDWAELRGQNATRGDIDNQVDGDRDRLVWKIDHLPAGASEQMFVRLTAARSGTYDLDVDWTLVPQKSVAKVHVHEPRLDLTIEGPDEVVYGQSQTYKVRVLNPGDGIAPNVVFTLSPNSATPQTQRIGDIPPGKEAQFDVELTAQDLGDLKIHGLASGDLELRAESAKTIRVAAAQLEAVLTGPELKYQNTDAMYGLQVQNNGNAASEKIVATLRMPGGVKYLGGIEDAVVQGNVLRWEITSLAPGATRDYQFTCNMATTGEHLFAFDCRGTAAGNTDVSISTQVESIADLVLAVSDPTAPAPIGSEVTYEIVIRNRGSKEATDVRAIAQFSHGIEPQRIEGQSGEVVTGQVLFDPIPRIGAGQEIRMRVIAKADRAGHHRFRTEVRSGDTVLVAEEATHYMSPQSERVSRRSSNAASR